MNDNETVEVRVPYNLLLARAMGRLPGAVWQRGVGTWRIRARDASRARALVARHLPGHVLCEVRTMGRVVLDAVRLHHGGCNDAYPQP
jgi:hypothetical protein